MSRQALAGALATISGAAVAVFDFVKFDIIRDFFQMIGLFFASIASEALDKAKVYFFF